MNFRYFQLMSLKAILFYGTTLVSVIVLFSMTTAYGESYLKAATKIAGTYAITVQTKTSLETNQNVSCLKDVLFRLDQSGQYLTAELVSSPPPIALPPQSTFSGTWSGRLETDGRAMIKLTGSLPLQLRCNWTTEGRIQKGWIEGYVVNQIFSGNLIVGTGDRVPFVAKAIEQSPNKSTH